MNENLKYIALAVFLGIICKIYDDVADNMLYHNFNISDDNICYVDDILKGLFIIGFSILSINNPFFLISFTILNALLYFICKADFKSYEFSSFVSPIILLPFLKWNKEINYYLANIIWLIILLILLIILEKNSNKEKNKEYSKKKLFMRLFFFLLILVGCPYSSSLYITSDILKVLYFCGGYLFVSCITQYCLLNGIWKCGNSNITDNIKEEGIKEEGIKEEGIKEESEK